MLTYGIIFIILLILELLYFKVADKFNIIDKPNERSSHSTIILRGGGIIFLLSMFVWCAFFGIDYPWFILAISLVAVVSFIDDIHSLPNKLRLTAQFIAMLLIFYQLSFLNIEIIGKVIPILIVCVGAVNIINFMDGINGINCAYGMSCLLTILMINTDQTDCRSGFIDNSLVITTIIANFVLCIFNFRPKGKAKCFGGDVGSIGLAYILMFMIGKLVASSGDITYIIFLSVYGVDGCLTIIHRIMLHENIGEAHRKHAFQIMANELKIGHLKVSLFYTILQLIVNLGFIYICPNVIAYHWIYLSITTLILCYAYYLFMNKYYHLHEEYLESLKK